MPRPRIHDEKVRRALLEAAGSLVTAEGYQALSLRRLAADAGTSTSAVYSLFGGKPGLVRELHREAFRRFAEHLSAVRPSNDPVMDILRLGQAYRRSALDDPQFYMVMFGGRRSEIEFDEESSADAAATFTPLLDAVTRAVETGLFQRADPAVIATALWAGLHGLVSLELGDFLPPQAGDPAEAFTVLGAAMADLWRDQPSTRSR